MSGKRKVQPWYLPSGVHRTLRNRGRVARLRARDGEDCWFCRNPMRFGGLPNCGKAATIEHLEPKSRGGTSALENLVLCHVGCNRHLANRSREEKERERRARLRPEPRPERRPDPGRFPAPSPG